MARLFRTKEEGKKSLWDRIVDVALTDVTVLVKGLDEGSLEGLEETLIAADFGVPSTLRLVEEVGFCRLLDLDAGGSPDGLIDDDGGLEIKCPERSAVVDSVLGGR